MSSVNKAMILGHLGGDPEVRYAQSGKAVANFTVATSERWTDQSDNRQERTEWHRITAWGKTAELCKQYIRKGSQVFIEGRIQTRKWQDKDGADRYTTEIVADSVTFLDKAPDRQQQQSGGSGEQRQGGQSGGWSNRQQTPPPSDSGGFDDGDIPF